MPPSILRLAYISEFLLALLTILTFWSEIGGQDHLDLMPWSVKLCLSAGLAFAVVMTTVSVVADEKALNRKALTWMGVIAVILVAIAAVTYYYHLHENDDEQEKTGTPNPVAWTGICLEVLDGQRGTCFSLSSSGGLKDFSSVRPPAGTSPSREASATARFAVPAAKA